MDKKYGGWRLSMIVLLVLVLTGCGIRIKNETIIISEKEAYEQTDQDFSPVQVKKIYRLPDESVDKGYWLGWSSSDSLIGSFKNSGFSERFMLKRLAYPFEQSENIIANEMDNSRMALSPDGRHAADVHINRTTITTQLISTNDGTTKEVDIFNLKDQNYLQNMAWSDNSQYIGYLVLDAAESQRNSLRIYDTKAKASKSYTLNGFNERDTLLEAQVSNDGRSALIKLFDSSQSGKTTVVLGKLIDEHFEFKYKRQIADKQITWTGDDQFAFLGRDGTLYEYDQRNGEISVTLERVSAFEFSSDKKFIAYTLQDEDAVYIAKMQGRNVLYNVPIYHGILPLNMKWNLGNTSLFIQGPKIFANPKITQNDDPTVEPAFVIEFE